MTAESDMAGGPVVIDLQAAQSAGYRERGVARYAVDFTRAVVTRHPAAIDRVHVNSSLPPLGGIDALIVAGKLTTSVEWDGEGGLYHVLSPFDLDLPVRTLWPRLASVRRMRLVVTVYDLIPEIFPDLYLVDPGQRRRYRARRELIRAADHIFTLSEAAATDVIERLGVAEQKVSVVGAACSENFRPPAHRADSLALARAAVDGLRDRFVVYNGAVEPRKNMERLIEAYAALPLAVRDVWQLLLVCRLNPLQRNHYEMLARRLGIQERLVLTGFVTDETLVALYQAADLVVYPSLYEGYGLPVAEAMACGAPVIAADTSALRELVDEDARFDPSNAAAITAALERALADSAYRGRLASRAATTRSTWDDVADRAVEVYDRLRRPGSRGRSVVPGWRRRPLIGFVTPLPPAPTGVANYSARLVSELASLVDVDVFVDGDDPHSAQAIEGVWHFPVSQLTPIGAVRGGYDAVVICLGNSEFHAGALKLLREGPRTGVVIAHDVRLTGLYRHAEARGAVREGFVAALRAMYPGLGPSVASEGWLSAEESGRSGLLMAREVIALAQRFLTTSEYAAALARSDALPEHAERVGVLPFAYPPVVARTGVTVPEGLICSFGVMNESKQPFLVLEAFAQLIAARPDARLAFVGPVSAVECRRIEALAENLHVRDRVEVTGRVSDSAYERWLGQAAVAIQLRAFSNGEMSAAVGDCLTHGVATIVSDLGGTGAIPEDVVEKLAAGIDSSDLAGVMLTLLNDGTRREALATAARRFVTRHDFRRAAVELLGYLGVVSVSVGTELADVRR